MDQDSAQPPREPDEECGSDQPGRKKLPAHPIRSGLIATASELAEPQAERPGAKAGNPDRGKDELPPDGH